MHHTPIIAIACGDVTGIGPEVTLKALRAELDADQESAYVLFGDLTHLRKLNEALGLGLALGPFTSGGAARVQVHNPFPNPLPPELRPGAARAARAAVCWLRTAAQWCLDGRCHALVTAPVNKAAIIQAGHAFTGQTEFLAQLAGVEDPVMMLLGPDARRRWLRVALATTHLALREVPQVLNPQKVLRAIRLAAQACKELGLPTARVAVCGLNPHAGESGHFGTEEQNVITPAVQQAQREGIAAEGPWPADTVFFHALEGAFDAVVAMYHDQGLPALKLVAFHTGVNWTLGLPFVRTSPDHGTAYDIAGRGCANPSSMKAAIQLARHLATAKPNSPPPPPPPPTKD